METRRGSSGRCELGRRTDWDVPWLFGPIVAAFGAVEAQGRGSLHPHILVWLLQAPTQELLELLLRDRAAFKERLNTWMHELVRAVASVQESAVTELPKHLHGGGDTAGADVPPLPFGPNERRYLAPDGGTECQIYLPVDIFLVT